MAGPVIASTSATVSPAGLHRLEDLHQAVDAKPVGDEPGVSFATTTPFPSRRSAKSITVRRTAGVGVGSRDHFEQRQVSRRIEEMRPQPAFPEGGAAAFGDARDRDARRVGRDDGRGRGLSFDAFDQRLLDVEPFDDRFDDPVARSQRRPGRRSEPVWTSAAVDLVKNGSGLSACARFRPCACGVEADVEQQRRARRRWRGAPRSGRPSCRRQAPPPSGCRITPAPPRRRGRRDRRSLRLVGQRVARAC